MIIKLTVLSLLCTCLIKVLSIIYTYVVMRIKLTSIPGPPSIPMLGSLLEILIYPKDELFRLIWQESDKYKNGMFVIWYGNEAMLNVRKPHQMEVILKSQTLLNKSSTYSYLSDWLGNGLVTATGDVWHRHRRLLTPAFHFAVLEQFSKVIDDKVTILNESIKSSIDQDPHRRINIFPMAIQFTLDVVCRTVMGIDLDIQRKGQNEYIEALHSFMDVATERVFRFWLWPDLLFNLTLRGQLYRRSIKTMHDFTRKVINEKIKMRKERADEKAPIDATADSGYSNITPFLDLLIDLGEADENPLTLEEIREQVDTFMFAAHDTTGIAISYALFCLGNAPEAQDQVYKEIREIADSSDEPLTKQQLARLKYLDRVMKESLRLFPSAPYISRQITHNVTIDGHVLPKGIQLHMLIMQMHWDPEIWEDPDKFNPDRFLPENSIGRHPYAYIPFSAGPRNCIGQKYAMLLMKIALVNILRKWIVYSDVAINDLKLVTNVVLTPSDQILNLRFQPRHCRL